MKILIITVIALVVPAFFLFVLVMGTYGRLASLRRRCQQLAPSTAPPEQRPDNRAYLDAVARYDAERNAFPASLISRLFGFGPIDESERVASRSNSQR